MDRLLWYVFAGSRGGATRVRIVSLLLDRPHNTNELSRRLGLDYKTVEYQLRVLSKHVYVVQDGADYGRQFSPSKNLLAALSEFKSVTAKVIKDPDQLGKDRNTAAQG